MVKKLITEYVLGKEVGKEFQHEKKETTEEMSKKHSNILGRDKVIQ